MTIGIRKNIYSSKKNKAAIEKEDYNSKLQNKKPKVHANYKNNRNKKTIVKTRDKNQKLCIFYETVW